MKIKIQDIPKLNLLDYTTSIIREGKDKGYVSITWEDGKKGKMPTRMFLIHCLLWRPYFHFNLPVTQEYVYDIPAIKSGTWARIQSIQYRELLVKLPDVPSMDIVNQFWEVINDVYQFIYSNLGAYQKSLSMLSLARVHEDPKVKAIISRYMDPSQGTKVAEMKLAQMYKEFEELIGTRGALEYNPLIDFMETGSLKANQIPQMMIAYGPRSDIDDSMMSHVINESAMSGLKSPHDFACESLAAKKAAYFNKVVIRKTQYFARRLRLNASVIRHMYPGNCGSDVTIPITIPKKHSSQFINKSVYYEGKKVYLTDENHKDFADKRVNMISPLGCRYTDGICEHCAGRGDRPWAYLPPNIHIGLFSATKVGKSVSQMVLSAKHLIKTNTLVYTLNEMAAKHFKVDGTNIRFKEQYAKARNLSIRVKDESIGHISDLEHGVLQADSFSEIEEFDLVDGQGNIVNLNMRNDKFIPFLSANLLKHMGKNLSKIEHDDDYYIIPLKGFDMTRPIMEYIVINDDMISFSSAVDKMMTTKIGDYTSLSNVLHDLTSLLYSKSRINVFFVEVLLKTFLRNPDNKTGIPVVTDVDSVLMGKMKENIKAGSVSMKLGHERLGESGYFGDVATSMEPKDKGLYKDFFGFTS